MIVNWNFELTNLALAGVALWALLFARRQVGEMRASNRKLAESAASQERQMRANVLLALDQRWESEPLISQRAEMQRVMDEVFVQIRAGAPDADMAQIRRLSAGVFVEMLELWMRTAPGEYLRLFQICGFFETVGYSVRAGYITIGDIHQLFGVSIIAAATVFRPFIQKLLREGADRSLYENFLWLVSEVEKREATCLAPSACGAEGPNRAETVELRSSLIKL